MTSKTTSKTTKTTLPSETLYRSALLKREHVDEEARTVEVAFSSELPVERHFGQEILDHDPKSVRLSRLSDGGPVLVDHNPGDHVGVVESVSIDADRRGRAVLRFGKSARAEEIFRDVVDGIRKSVSVGYRIWRAIEKSVDEGRDTIYRAVDWEPLEISLVAVPADATVGVGRGAEQGHEIEIQPVDTRESEMSDDKTTPAVKKEPAIDINHEREQAKSAERSRVASIHALGAKFECRDLADKAVADDLSVADFQRKVLDEVIAAREVNAKPAAHLDLNEREKQNYSLIRAIRTIKRNKEQGRSDTCYEFELSDQIAKDLGREAKGFFMPTDIRFGGQRDVTTSTATSTSKGGYLKGTDHLGEEFIDALRARLVARQAGARVLTGLRGDIDIPTLSTKTTAYWVGEGSAATEGAPVFGQKTASPKTCSAFVDITRRLMQQSDPVADQILRADMISQLAHAVDDVAFEGGATNAPSGILNTSGIGSVTIGTNGGAPTWATVVNLYKEVAIDNADMGSLAYVTTPGVIGKLLQTAKVSSTDSVMIMNDINSGILGFPVLGTTNMPSDLTKGSGSSLNAMIFGNWSDLIICEWSTIDIIVDPYSLSTAGSTRIVAFYDVDIVVRHAESFAECNEIVIT